MSLNNLKKWFAGSVVVDQTGAPIVVYHATRSDFDQFEVGRETVNSGTFGNWTTRRHAIFTTTDPLFAAEFAGNTGLIMPLYLRIENLMDMRGSTIWDYADRLANEGVSVRGLTSRLDTEMWEVFDDEDGLNLVAAAKKLGYDGAIMREKTAAGEIVDVYVVFDPAQIKSAIGNSGVFSVDSNSLTDGPH